MSTNTNGLPDIALLEQLANQLFRDEIPLPFTQAPQPAVGNSITALRGTQIQQPSQLSELSSANAANQTAFVAPQHRLSGVGAAIPVVGAADVLDLRSTQPDFLPEGFSSHPVYSTANADGIPVSVAGSGASPSAIEHGNNINIDNPQTGFPDRNLKQQQAAQPFPSGKETLHIAAGENIETALASFLQTATSFFVPVVDEPLSAIHPASVATFSPQPSFYFVGDELPANATQPSVVKQPVAASVLPGQLKQQVLPGFDAHLYKKDFPILNQQVNGKPLIWLDNAATTQKPQQVIDRLVKFYQYENSNIHRAAHELAARATDAYEEAREKVRSFINAASVNEIVFVRGTTEAINLVAKSWGEQYLTEGDEIIVSHLEHHANIVPWQQLAHHKKLRLKVIPVDDNGQVLLDEYAKLLTPKTRLVAFTQVSNALGTITPAQAIINMAHAVGAKVLLDGAQSISHIRTDVQSLNADWFVFSGHKIYGPTGIGVLYGKEALLNATKPWQGGGNMIQDVTFEYTRYHAAPARFEAGTGNIADAVGLGAALDYVNAIGIEAIFNYEHYLLEYATQLLKQIPGLKLIGTAKEKTSVLSFVLDGHTNDAVGQHLNKHGIAVRTGHHCAQPILRRFGLESTVRPSLAFYNTCQDVETLYQAVLQLAVQ